MANYGRALYYPYIHIRNETWLKKALLYYDGIDVIAPDRDVAGPESIEEERIRQFEITLSKGKDRFIRRVNPVAPARRVQDEFLEFALDHLADERRRRSLLRTLRYRIRPGTFYRVHPDKLADELRRELFELNLARPVDENPDIDLEPLTGAMYMVFLAKRIATPQGLPIVTDTPRFQPLIYKQLPAPPARGKGEAGLDQGFTLASFVIPSLVPRRLNSIPLDEVIDFRRETAKERRHFHTKVSELSKGIEEIDSRAALRRFLKQKQKDVNEGVQELEESLQTVGITCVRNIVGLSIPTFATAAWFTGASGLSAAVTGPAGVVLMAALTMWLAKRERDKTYRGSPWSYVLAIQNQFGRESLLRHMAQGTVLV